jgi:hypothetical protein
MRKLFWTAILVWGIAFAIGVVTVVWRTGQIERRGFAAREMPANHLLQSGDLDPSFDVAPFVGRYLRRHAIKGEMLTSADVVPLPLMPAGAGPIYVMPTPANLVGKDVEVDKTGSICRDTKSIASGEVVAIVCALPIDGGTCVAHVRASAEETKKLGESLKQGPGNFWFKLDCNK